MAGKGKKVQRTISFVDKKHLLSKGAEHRNIPDIPSQISLDLFMRLLLATIFIFELRPRVAFASLLYPGLKLYLPFRQKIIVVRNWFPIAIGTGGTRERLPPFRKTSEWGQPLYFYTFLLQYFTSIREKVTRLRKSRSFGNGGQGKNHWRGKLLIPSLVINNFKITPPCIPPQKKGD